MFTHQQIEHFRAFGFVVARSLFTPDETAALRTEVVDAIIEEFGGLGTDDDPDATGGIRGDYLPLALDRTSFSQSLIADDRRLFHGSVELLGRTTVPTVPIATCFTSNAGWHADHDPGVEGLKFLAHLDHRSAETGALRVLPGSHCDDLAARLQSYWAQDPGASGFEGWPVPHVVLETAPGDVIAVDAHLLHASEGGDKRVAWTIEYLCWPGDDRARLRAAVEESGPAWDEWAGDPAASSPSRQTAIQRLRLLGVLGQ